MKGYIDRIRQKIRLFPPRKEGQSGEEYARQRVILGLKYGVFALTAFAILRGMIVVAGENVTVSNSVNGKELPIYCVDTPEKKIALSFDAAWGNGRLMEQELNSGSDITGSAEIPGLFNFGFYFFPLCAKGV